MFFSPFHTYNLKIQSQPFFNRFGSNFPSILRFDIDHIADLNIDIFSLFHAYKPKIQSQPFSTNLAQIFTSLQTFDTDHIAALKIGIFFFLLRL